MRYLFAVLSLVILYAGTLAQQIDNGSGDNRKESKHTTKAVPTISREGNSFLLRRGYDVVGKTATNNRGTDISQISSFPFQEPYGTYRSYYESCPFVLSNGNLLVVYANPSYDSLYAVKSSDGGTTWSSPSFVGSSQYFNFISGIRTAQGRLIVAWAGLTAIGTGYGLSMCYSDNDGATWKGAMPISNNTADEGTTISQTLDGMLWLCYSRYNATTSYDAYCRTSTDNGNTWSAEKTIVATSFSEYYSTVVSKDSSTSIAFVVDNSSGFYNISRRTSTDGGTTWSPAIAIANTPTMETRPRVLRQADGTLWLLYQHYKPSTGGFTQSEIAYKKSTDSGATWSAISYLTNYAGYDGWFNACLVANRPFVTFASSRWCVLQSQAHLWYGLIGTSADPNTPPTLTYCFNSTPVQDSAMSILAFVDDEAGISNVQLSYDLNGVPHSFVQMYDDGLHGDSAAADKIYGVTVGPFRLGDVFDYSIGISDINSNTVNVYVNSFAITYPAVHNAGNVILKFSANSELGDLGASPGEDVYWPKTNGYDYLYDGGLWVGCNVGGQNLVKKHFYEVFQDWHQTYATLFTLAPGKSDQDGDVTYDDWISSSPIGLQVHQQSYQWSNNTRDDFIIFKYTIINLGLNANLNNVYVGLCTDPDVAAETNPNYNAVGYDSQRHMVYAYNTQKTPTGYFGVKLLGAGTVPSTVYSWLNGQLDEGANMPFYQCLTQGGTTLPKTSGDVRMLLTAPPFSLAEYDSEQIAFGIVLGNGLSGLQASADTMEAIFDKTLTSVEPATASKAIPKEISLSQNYPNPFNPSTIISYSIPTRSCVSLSVFNTLGQKVAELVNTEKDAGSYDVTFDAAGLASGVYLYRMQAGSFVQTKKLVVVK